MTEYHVAITPHPDRTNYCPPSWRLLANGINDLEQQIVQLEKSEKVHATAAYDANTGKKVK